MTEFDTGKVPARRPSRLTVWMLVLVFFGPLAGAWVLFYGFGWTGSQSLVNHGTLLDPVRPLVRISLPDLNGDYVEPDFLIGKWSLIYIDGTSCAETCRKKLIDTRQLWRSFGKDMHRIQRVFLVAGGKPDMSYLDIEQPGLVSLRVDVSRELLDGFAVDDGISVTDADRIYLADPRGNLVLIYEADAELKDIKTDLKRLLKLSRIG